MKVMFNNKEEIKEYQELILKTKEFIGERLKYYTNHIIDNIIIENPNYYDMVLILNTLMYYLNADYDTLNILDQMDMVYLFFTKENLLELQKVVSDDFLYQYIEKELDDDIHKRIYKDIIHKFNIKGLHIVELRGGK